MLGLAVTVRSELDEDIVRVGGRGDGGSCSGTVVLFIADVEGGGLIPGDGKGDSPEDVRDSCIDGICGATDAR